MNCLEAEEQFSAYLEDELDYQAVKAFDAHLADCESCHHELELFRESVDLLHQLPSVEPSPSFDVALRTRLTNTEVDPVPLWHSALEMMRIRPAWTFSGIAMALFIMIASIYLYQNTFRERPQAGVSPDARVTTSTERRLTVPFPTTQGPFKFRTSEDVEFLEEIQPRRVERNYILQTVSYTDAPAGGGL